MKEKLLLLILGPKYNVGANVTLSDEEKYAKSF